MPTHPVPRTGSMAEYSRHRGITRQSVTELRQARRLVIVRDGARPIVDFDASDRLVDGTGDLEREGSGANAGGRGARAATDEQALRVAGIYRQSQAQDKAYIAKMREIEYRRRAGELIDRASAERAAFTAFRVIRDRVMGMVPRLAAQLGDEMTTQQRTELLDEAMRGALTLVAGDVLPVDFERLFGPAPPRAWSREVP